MKPGFTQAHHGRREDGRREDGRREDGRREDGRRGDGQRGSGLVEFCFTIPILLLVAGATIDLSRYMRFLQITTFVSQEAAGQIYRQCSDITIYDPPEYGTTGLRVNTALTQTAIKTCLERVQAGAQQLLNVTVGRAAVSSKVFRWRLGDPTIANACANVTAMGQNVTTISAQANMSTTGISASTLNDIKLGDTKDDGTTTGFSYITWLSLFMNGRSRSGVSSPDSQTETTLTAEGVQLFDGGIYQTKNGGSGGSRLLVTPANLCQRGRIATVEVSYAFQPVVKFLPGMMMKLNTDGSQRDTTVL
jgi:Flp pilus assembly protein TadG